MRQYPRRYWTDPRVQIRSSDIRGHGLFARTPFRAGEIIEVMGGDVMTEAESLRCVMLSVALTPLRPVMLYASRPGEAMIC